MQFSGKVTTVKNVGKSHNSLLKLIQLLMDVNNAEAIAMLVYMNWDTSRLSALYFVERDEIKVKAGLLGGSMTSTKMNATCSICQEKRKHGMHLGCSHVYCLQCWQKYLKTKLEYGDQALHALCMESKCKQLVTRDVFKKTVSSSLLKRYDDVLLESYIDLRPDLVRCPGGNCGNLIGGFKKESMAKCDCGLMFCTGCLLDGHYPVSCEMILKWTAEMNCFQEYEEVSAKENKRISEERSMNYIATKAKRCPKCGVPTQILSGCANVHCLLCSRSFSWTHVQFGSTTTGKSAIPNKFLASKIKTQLKQTSKYWNEYTVLLSLCDEFQRSQFWYNEKRSKVKRRSKHLEKLIEHCATCIHLLKYCCIYEFCQYSVKPKQNMKLTKLRQYLLQDATKLFDFVRSIVPKTDDTTLQSTLKIASSSVNGLIHFFDDKK